MTGTTQTLAEHPNYGADSANALALRLAYAEAMLEAFTSNQIDAIVDPSGRTYLLRTAQEQLLQNETWLRALFESVPDVITVLNKAGELLHQSPAVTRVLGYHAGELIGRSVLEFVHPDDLPEFERAFSQVIGNVLPTTPAEFRHRARDGSWCPLEASLPGPLSNLL